MAQQTLGVGNMNTPQDQRAAFDQLVDVPAFAKAKPWGGTWLAFRTRQQHAFCQGEVFGVGHFEVLHAGRHQFRGMASQLHGTGFICHSQMVGI